MNASISHPRPLLAALAVALAFGAAACAKDPTSGKSRAEVAEAVAEEGAPAAAELLEVGPATSSVGFVGAKVTAQHVGVFHDFAGVIHLVDGTPEKSRIEFEVQTAALTVDGGIERLENHLRSADFFDSANHPSARFVSTAIRAGSDAAGMTHTVTGNLEIRGTRKSVTFPARIAVTREAVEVQTEFGIDRQDFGVSYPGLRDDLIKDNVLIRAELRAPRTSSRS
jgi:polyisoprenoid-binding protein YceI